MDKKNPDPGVWPLLPENNLKAIGLVVVVRGTCRFGE